MGYIMPPVLSVEDFREFRNRVIQVRAKIKKRPGRGYGTQATIAQDCRMNPSRVSNVLRARNIDFECLERIELWLRAEGSGAINFADIEAEERDVAQAELIAV